ncbi:hypothetical protein [Streptomyces sp. HUAS ZL42]|uniref:hypothetical protein n=1 Tax=Streptomyces sp. HUAS ZL42 TaxID=3231715 RepID=UPI00345E8C25
MKNVSVSRDDIDALTQAVDSGTLPAQDLLRSLLSAILSAADGDEPINVSVEVGTLQDTFEAAFIAEPAAEISPSGRKVRVTVAKIGR